MENKYALKEQISTAPQTICRADQHGRKQRQETWNLTGKVWQFQSNQSACEYTQASSPSLITSSPLPVRRRPPPPTSFPLRRWRESCAPNIVAIFLLLSSRGRGNARNAQQTKDQRRDSRVPSRVSLFRHTFATCETIRYEIICRLCVLYLLAWQLSACGFCQYHLMTKSAIT